MKVILKEEYTEKERLTAIRDGYHGLGNELFILCQNHAKLSDELKEKLRKDTALVSIMWANNETGVINPVEEIAEIIKTRSADTKFFVDGVQAGGKILINLKDTQIDMVGISGHKLHAPKGIGALYIKNGTR